jgi:hypothetical protein
MLLLNQVERPYLYTHHTQSVALGLMPSEQIKLWSRTMLYRNHVALAKGAGTLAHIQRYLLPEPEMRQCISWRMLPGMKVA